MLWVDASQQPSTHAAAQSLSPLHLQQDEGERSSKSKKTQIEIKSLISEGKRKEQITKWCQDNHSLPPTGRLMPSQSANNSHLGNQHTFFLYLVFISEGDDTWYENSPLASLGWLSQPRPSQSLSSPSLLAVGAEQEKEKALTLCKMAAAKTWMCYQCWFSHKSETQPHMGCHEDS